MSGEDRAGEPRRPATVLTHGGRRREWTQGIVNPPVWRASTIVFDDVASLRETEHDTHHRLYYGRRGTPTQWSLADALTALEPGAEGTLLYPSGVAAIAMAMMTVLTPGDEVLVVDSAYGPTRAFCNGTLKTLGITTRYYDPLANADIVALIGEKTRAILLESPGSLTFEVQDVPAIVAIARERGIATLIDNSWATPLLFPAMALGVDLSILACTKYVVGHSDVMLGSVTANARWWGKLRATTHSFGQCASPDDAWLAARGLRTMDVRLARHQENGLKLAHWLKDRPEVARVLHPALPDCPGHATWQRDFKGASGLFAFELAGGDDAARTALIDALELFSIGFSWGGYESLALPSDPVRTATPWKGKGLLVRLHAGLEDPDDLIADLEQGFVQFRRVRG